ncbi:P-loop containing nucleoside triphosphate hydrolase protein [Paxillus ammoniavirescens]|nr:P-loop containing nucleoside triphosphate hydrolase protein [Paxillus ammoniavirescens]
MCKPKEDLSTTNLNWARDMVQKNHKYDSKLTRLKICEEFEKRTNGKKPYDWQLNVAEALLTGLDCIVVAGTGAGKTMPFMMPLLVQPKKHIIIISPLDALENDQARRFQDLGLTAVAVNGKTYDVKLHKELEQQKYQLILTSPEMCLQHTGFCELLSSLKFACHVAAIVVDEAHCITQWGHKFCEQYFKLGSLRAFVPSQVPVLVTSATLPPQVLSEVCSTMHIKIQTSYFINLGIDHPNITWEVRHIAAAKSDLESLRFLLLKRQGSKGEENSFKQSMVFGDDISQLMRMCRWVRENSSPELRNQVAVYHSQLTPRTKKMLLERFQMGEIKVLFTTEAAGMGCDMPHIELVIQFMVPASLSIWMQRAGHAGHSPSLQVCAILLVQPSVFQAKKEKKETHISEATKDPDKCEGSVTYVKAVEDGLREWLETKSCHRDVADKYFNSSMKRKRTVAYLCVL